KPKLIGLPNIVEKIFKEPTYSELSAVEVSLKEGDENTITLCIPRVIERDLQRQTIEIDGNVIAKGMGDPVQKTKNCFENCFNALGTNVVLTTNVLKICN